jgi:hypothetical protein
LKVQEVVRSTAEYINIGNNFLNRIPMAQQIRERINKWDCIRLTSFYTAKETVTRHKRLTTEWEKILASYSSNKGLIISKIYSKLKKFNPQRINNSMKKWTHELNREFSKAEVQMLIKT